MFLKLFGVVLFHCFYTEMFCAVPAVSAELIRAIAEQKLQNFTISLLLWQFCARRQF